MLWWRRCITGVRVLGDCVDYAPRIWELRSPIFSCELPWLRRRKLVAVMHGRGGWYTRLDVATTASCRCAAWVAGCRRGRRGRGEGVGVGAHRCVQGKSAAMSTSAAARDAALGAAKPPRLRREHHQEGKDGEGGVFAWWCRVQECGALRRHWDRPKNCFQPAATPFWFEGAGEARGGSKPVVTSIGLTEGKEGGSSEPRTKAWSRVGDGDNDDVVMAALDHRRPGFGRLYRLGLFRPGSENEKCGWARLLLDRARDLIINGSAHRGASGVAMPTDEDDQDGHFFYNHPERGAYFAA